MDNLINLIISTTSITVAILVTYFFSKLFAERQDRIQRKASIDVYAKKVTSLRRIAHNIKSDFEFWRPFTEKGILDTKYKDLMVAQFRNLESNEYFKVSKELRGELAPQAYMALREIANIKGSDFEVYKSFQLWNYSLIDIGILKENCHYYCAFCEEYKTSLSFDNSTSYRLNNIREEFLKIKGRSIENKNFFSEILNLFNDFHENIFPEIFFFTEQNQRKVPVHFFWISFNLIIYILIMVISILLFIIPMDNYVKSNLLIVMISLFTINTLDIVAGLFMSIPRELKIKEFYKI